MNQTFGGILPAVVSPCNEKDEFLDNKFAEIITGLYKQDIDGLYICGGTGEGIKMHIEERKYAAEIAIDISKRNNGKSIIHVGASSTRDALELAEHAAGIGADAISSVPPAGCSHRELLSYYRDIACASGIPVFVYYIPAFHGQMASVEDMLELLDIEGVVGLKLTDWNLFYMKRLLMERPDAIVFSGYDEFLFPALSFGAHGGIGMWYNLFPKVFVEIFKLIKRGELLKAAEYQNTLNQFLGTAWKFGVCEVFDMLMNEYGLAPKCFRRPCVPFDLTTKNMVMKEIKQPLDAVERLMKGV